jgi:hypothetical protein
MNLLHRSGSVSKTQGELKVQAKATMFMKIKDRECCKTVKATMLMKTQGLYF